MCGIAGYCGTNSKLSKELLQRQSDVLRHRGPDDEGIYVDRDYGFAFRRLSIIDVATGNQPRFSEKKKIVSIFNGEIYNFKELRESLIGRGHSLVSPGDAEVIPHLYEEFGVSFLEMLEGMFAIAIWDDVEKKLILARDRFGEKPLWYETGENYLTFASEIKALMQFNQKREIDYQGVVTNLLFGYSGIPNSCISGIKMVPPATYLSYQAGVIEQESYWRPNSQPSRFNSMDEATDELEKVLSSSISGRLISERPLGIFLSGGIDSSIIAALASKLTGERIKTFSLGFEESDFDESARAAKTAWTLGTEHQELILRPDPNWIFEKLPKILDSPFADSSFIPTFFLSEFAAKEVTVALSGDGGDEGFGGYDRYRFNLLWSRFTRNFFSLSSLDELHTSNRRTSKFIRAIRFSNPALRYVSSTELISQSVLQKLLHLDLLDSLEFSARGIVQYEEVKSSNFQLRQMQEHDLKHYLPGDLMFKVDYASMAHGLEVRAPFLSRHVVEFGLNLPDKFKVGMKSNKLILRNLASRYLDSELIWRKKKGFAIPKANWIRGPLFKQVSELLLDKSSFVGGICRREVLSQLLIDHEKGAERDEVLWPLIILELWYQELKWGK